MVPQDGFLFDGTIAENVSYGAVDPTEAEIVSAFDRLGLSWWLDKHGLETEGGGAR